MPDLRIVFLTCAHRRIGSVGTPAIVELVYVGTPSRYSAALNYYLRCQHRLLGRKTRDLQRRTLWGHK